MLNNGHLKIIYLIYFKGYDKGKKIMLKKCPNKAFIADFDKSPRPKREYKLKRIFSSQGLQINFMEGMGEGGDT